MMDSGTDSAMLLQVDALQVAIAAATAATFVGIVAVAIYQAWLNRAWLDISLKEAAFDEAPSTSHPPHMVFFFAVIVSNRSRRRNSLVDLTVTFTSPGSKHFSTRSISGNFPVLIEPAQQITLDRILFTLKEGDAWFGKQLSGELSVVDINGKVHKMPIEVQIPDGPVLSEYEIKRRAGRRAEEDV